ncbi:MAG: glyoxalase [Balneolaceae bacterium]|nr:MAG: glyoxalase [Balneolaceae bacterium]
MNTPGKTQLPMANLPVKDVEQTRQFYTDMGFRPNEGHKSEQLTSFFAGDNNLVVHFFQEDIFKKHSAGAAANLNKGNEVMFTIAANSREEVNTWAEQVKKAGGSIFAEPAELQNNWYGCGFADPEGHKWNVFYNGK